MINALVKPQFKSQARRRHHTPVFGKNYDWSEYTRVWEKAIPEIVDNAEDAWSELVKHIDDDRDLYYARERLRAPSTGQSALCVVRLSQVI